MRNQPILFILALLGVYGCISGESTGDINSESKPVEGYEEQHRPQLHFSPPQQWMNDPNGMVYYDGEYHLFYQHYPDANVWGPMHWGHAVSTDLVHWENLPIALYPDELGYIFSGSAVMDHQNTSGFGTAENPPMVAIYTYHDTAGLRAGTNTYQTQGVAFSTDRGRSWTKYEGNPVVPNPGIKDFRDPKVFWHKETEQWVMIFAAADRVRIYNSSDLKDWELASEFGQDQGSHGGVWECPDLFELPVEGTGTRKWMMIVSLGDGNPNGGSGTQYFIGEFDGKTFVNDNPKDEVLWVEYGTDNYAGVTWSDIPANDGRRLFLGWMSNWRYATKVPTYAWRSAMTVPRALSFTQFEGKTILKTQPVRELETLRGESYDIEPGPISGKKELQEIPTGLMEIELTLQLDPDERPEFFALELANAAGEKILIGYKSEANEYFINRRDAGKADFHEQFADIHIAPATLDDEHTFNVHLFVDVASVELFADGGKTVMTDIFFPNEDFTLLNLVVEKGKAKVLSGKVHELQSIWK